MVHRGGSSVPWNSPTLWKTDCSPHSICCKLFLRDFPQSAKLQTLSVREEGNTQRALHLFCRDIWLRTALTFSSKSSLPAPPHLLIERIYFVVIVPCLHTHSSDGVERKAICNCVHMKKPAFCGLFHVIRINHCLGGLSSLVGSRSVRRQSQP